MRLKMSKFFLLFLALSTLLCGCFSQNEGASDQIKIVTTIAPQEEFIRSVGGNKVQVTVIVPPGAEPHTFEPTPKQFRQLAEADIYIKNGAGLEFWIDKLLLVNEDMLIVDTSLGIDLIGGDGVEIDPHIWLSLRNAAIQVDNIYEALIEFDPDNAEYFLRNRDDYLRELAILDAELNQTFASKDKKTFIVDHPAWTYFARDYGLEQMPLMENETEPGPRYLARIVDFAKKNNIHTIFAEPEFNPKAAEVIAREMDAQVVTLDPLAGNYLENMRHVGNKIAENL
jgi:zinc transport system substrate-binding protein